MKLEIKHLASYLPYELQVKTIIWQRNINEHIESVETFCTYLLDNMDSYVEFKPILHPLSSLTKEIEINGEKFVPYIELFRSKYNYITEGGMPLNSDDINIVFGTPLDKNAPSFRIWHSNLAKSYTNISFSHLSGKLLCDYDVYEKLLEWKFNVFNLDESLYVKVTDEFNPYK